MSEPNKDPDELVPVECAGCTIRFGVTRRYYERRLEDGTGFTCPCGHSNVYPKPENDATKLRARIAELEAEVRGLKVEKAQLTHELDQLKAKHGVET